MKTDYIGFTLIITFKLRIYLYCFCHYKIGHQDGRLIKGILYYQYRVYFIINIEYYLLKFYPIFLWLPLHNPLVNSFPTKYMQLALFGLLKDYNIRFHINKFTFIGGEYVGSNSTKNIWRGTEKTHKHLFHLLKHLWYIFQLTGILNLW